MQAKSHVQGPYITPPCTCDASSRQSWSSHLFRGRPGHCLQLGSGRLVSRGQQEVYHCPRGVGQATCSEGGLDIASNFGLECNWVTDQCGTTRLGEIQWTHDRQPCEVHCSLIWWHFPSYLSQNCGDKFRSQFRYVCHIYMPHTFCMHVAEICSHYSYLKRGSCN